MTVFNKNTREKFKSLPEEEVLKAYNASQKMPDTVDVRNLEDTMISIALRNRGLSVFDKSKHSDFYKYLKDYLSIPEDMRVRYVAVFDTETTDRYNAHAVSLAVVLVDLVELKQIDSYYTLINPKDRIAQDAYDVHKISATDVMNEKTFEELSLEILSKFDNVDAVCGHNVAFDLKVMERELGRIDKPNYLSEIPVLDTMFMSKEIVNAVDVKGKLKNPKIEEAMNYLKIEQPEGDYHNALVDTQATADILIELMKMSIEDVESREKVFRK